MSRVRTLHSDRPSRRGSADRVGVASVQPVQQAYRPPVEVRSPRGWRDPWVVVGVLVLASVALGWHNNPPMSSTDVPMLQRFAQLVVAGAPVLALLAWLSAILRSRVGGGGWGPAALVVAGGVWALLLATVLVLQGAKGSACDGLPHCLTSSGARLTLMAPLAATWIAARLLEGALVRRRAGMQWRAPQRAAG